MFELRGGIFANGAATAAFASLVASAANSGRGASGGDQERASEILRDKDVGPATVTNDGKVHIRKHGGDALTADEVKTVTMSLDKLFAEERGQQALKILSADNPLEIRLNSEGLNFGGRFNRQARLTIDLNSKLFFRNQVGFFRRPTPVTVDRLLAHEINESVFREKRVSSF